MEGFLNSYRETGYLPRWLSPDERGVMPGTMVDAVIADAYAKKIGQSLMPEFLKAMVHSAENESDDPKYGRPELNEYLHWGYVPASYKQSVSKTLDYAYSDWLVSVVAGEQKELATCHKYQLRSKNYRRLFDQNSGLMRAKTEQGYFAENFISTDWSAPYAEGSAWQSSFEVQQDFPGLIKLYGGVEAFCRHLDDLVNSEPVYKTSSHKDTIHEMREMVALDFGQLAISNQPSFHIPYLFAVAGKAFKTQLLVKQLLLSGFVQHDYPGDEDNGSMSSWYLLSSMGFYPVSPGSGQWTFGIPFYDHIVVNLQNGRTLDIQTSRNHDHCQFVQTRTFNGRACSTQIAHGQLCAGGILSTKLGVLPSK